MNDEVGIGCATEATVVERVVFDRPVVVHTGLTVFENTLMNRLEQEAGQPVSKAELDFALYGEADRSARSKHSNTVEVFVKRLRKKIGEGKITTLRGRGYRLEK